MTDVSPTQDGSHLREAYLSVILADGEVASAVYARTADDEEVGVVGVVDHEAVPTAMLSLSTDWYE